MTEITVNPFPTSRERGSRPGFVESHRQVHSTVPCGKLYDRDPAPVQGDQELDLRVRFFREKAASVGCSVRKRFCGTLRIQMEARLRVEVFLRGGSFPSGRRNFLLIVLSPYMMASGNRKFLHFSPETRFFLLKEVRL